MVVFEYFFNRQGRKEPRRKRKEQLQTCRYLSDWIHPFALHCGSLRPLQLKTNPFNYKTSSVREDFDF